MLDKFYDIFELIEEKLRIHLNDFTYESNRAEEYLKTSVSDETYFREGEHNIIADKNTKYTCSVLLQTQSVYYTMKDNDNIRYYPQVLLEQCGYRPFSNNVLFHKDLEFTDNKPHSESEEVINENAVFG